MAKVKPEVMSYVWLQTSDGTTHEVEIEVALSVPLVCREIISQKGVGASKYNAVILPERISPATQSLVLHYRRFHQAVGRSDKDRKAFDKRLVHTDLMNFRELAAAAVTLEVRPLKDLVYQTIAGMIEGKSSEEMREILNLPDDLTEDVVVDKVPVDNRSIDELLKFIDGDDEDSKDDESVSEPKAELESSFNKPVSPKSVSSVACDDQNKQDSLNVPVSPTTKLDDVCEDDDAQDSFDGDNMSDDDEVSPKTKEQLDSTIVPLESPRNVYRNQEPKQVKAPKHHIGHSKSPSHNHPPIATTAAAITATSLQYLSPQPLNDLHNPIRVIENRDEHPDRNPELAREHNSFH
ncbi:SKP1-like protein [Drosera capensis]